MNTAKTYTVKGMVCTRCVSALQNALQQHNLRVNEITLGKVAVSANGDLFDEGIFSNLITSLGFSLSVNRNTRVVSQVKSAVKHYFSELDPQENKRRFSTVLSENLNMSYDNISAIFSAHENITIENYIISYRMELVKHMLCETNLTLTEIAYKTGFSSIHHLSAQFKDVTGITPSDFRTRPGISYKKHTSNSGNNITISGA